MHVFVIGSKGIPAKYGGFETFVDRLTSGRQNEDIQYHVSCMSDQDGEFTYNNAQCFNIKTPNIGSAAALWYDIFSLRYCKKYIEKNELSDCCIYILACRIGPYLLIYKKTLEKNKIKVFLNPDGHEWLRSKWNKLIKKYWKLSEKLMIESADVIVCDSKAIKDYICDKYSGFRKSITFIPYGADIEPITKQEDLQKFIDWKNEFKIRDSYYLIVGRFVPENNYYTILKEFIASAVDKDLVIITNIKVNKFYKKLLKSTSFADHENVKFVGTVYDQTLLSCIRENAFAYLHGHEVGGTNPSLLEAMAKTKVNILYDVPFNREVAEDAAVYFTKQQGSLASVLHEVETFRPEKVNTLGEKAKKRIAEYYSWNSVIKQYELLFSC